MHSDYIMRIIEQFAKAILAIMGFRKEKNYKVALEQIQIASRFYLNADMQILVVPTPNQLLNRFKKGNRVDGEQCIFCSDLLYELALIYEAQQFYNEALRLKISCLHLYTVSIPEEKQFQTSHYFEKVTSLVNDLKNHSLPEDILKGLSFYQRFLTQDA